jgi:hypothetical protein
MGSDLQVQLFLLRLRKVWTNRSCVILSPRGKNIESMARLGLVMEDIRTMCIELVPQEKIAGPCEDDKGRPGQIWIFHHMYRGQMMYLKLSLRTVNDKDYLTIVSCHEEGIS